MADRLALNGFAPISADLENSYPRTTAHLTSLAARPVFSQYLRSPYGRPSAGCRWLTHDRLRPSSSDCSRSPGARFEHATSALACGLLRRRRTAASWKCRPAISSWRRIAREPEEGPLLHLHMQGFSMLAHEVTNREFAAFVTATGYVTDAERSVERGIPGAGSALFATEDPERSTAGTRRLASDANWRAPDGEGSSIEGKDLHPVVHVSLRDATWADAEWSGRACPRKRSGSTRRASASPIRSVRIRAPTTKPARRSRTHGRACSPSSIAHSTVSPARHPSAVLRRARSASPTWRRQRLGVDRYAVRRRHEHHQGRLLPMRRQFLPPLSAGGASAAGRGLLHQSHRLPGRPRQV